MADRIDGVPAWLKAIAYRPAREEFYLDPATGQLWLGSTRERVLIVVPDNEYGTYRIQSVPVPDGYEYAGTTPEEWFRIARRGEQFISPYDGEAYTRTCDSLEPCIVIRPVEPRQTHSLSVVRPGYIECACGWNLVFSMFSGAWVALWKEHSGQA